MYIYHLTLLLVKNFFNTIGIKNRKIGYDADRKICQFQY